MVLNFLSTDKSNVAVVIVPISSQSHLNQLLHLAAVIASHSLPVHFVGSATHNRQAKLRSGLKPTATDNIQFHDLHTPPIATPEPSTTSSDKIPFHQWPAYMAYLGLGEQIGSLVQQLSAEARKIVLIYDRLVAAAVRVAVSIPNVESYAFSCLSALNLFCILWENKGRPFDLDEEFKLLPCAREFYQESHFDFLANLPDHCDGREGDIHNTSRSIESKYIDLLGREEIGGGKKQWAITPTRVDNSPHDSIPRHRCLEWLDNQPPRSVMYICFGSSTTLTNEEITELAAGLEESGKKFVWVVREADKADISAGKERRIELPDGFEERVRDNGIVETIWL